MTPSLSQDLWAPNGGQLHSFNIVEHNSVPKISRLEQHASTIAHMQGLIEKGNSTRLCNSADRIPDVHDALTTDS